jgi:putative phage-type endonuclease
MEQNSTEWHVMRRGKIGASDAPIILGLSPWQTPYGLWEYKMGYTENQDNPATLKGKALEPVARMNYESEVKKLFNLNKFESPPKIVTHETIPYIMASLDGFHEQTKTILEIKCPGKETHEMAKAGKVPDYYLAQLQHQMLAANANLVHYYSFFENNGALVSVCRDNVFITEKLMPALEKFWFLMQNKTPPELSDRDYVKTDDDRLVKLFKLWADLTHSMKQSEIALGQLKEEITLVAKEIGHPRISCNGFKYFEVVRKGNVAYEKIPELKGVDLEQYRKSPIKYTQITGPKAPKGA